MNTLLKHFYIRFLFIKNIIFNLKMMHFINSKLFFIKEIIINNDYTDTQDIIFQRKYNNLNL